jgi:hypothetical protein
MRPRAADLDSVPVGVPQLAGTPGSLYVRLENSGYYRYWEYMLRQPGVQENNVPERAI